MSNVVSLHAGKRWRAIIVFRTDDGQEQIEHFFEEIADLHQIIEHGPDWNRMIYCVVTLNRPDDGEIQASVEKALARREP